MEIEEVHRLVSESEEFLEDYRIYGRMVQDAIEALDRVEKLISDPTGGGLREALKIVEALRQQLEAYRDYVPTLAEKVDAIYRWLSEEAC